MATRIQYTAKTKEETKYKTWSFQDSGKLEGAYSSKTLGTPERRHGLVVPKADSRIRKVQNAINGSPLGIIGLQKFPLGNNTGPTC